MFDPFYEWLGIPPDEQPPNHYRLLGIRDFEPSLTVIENAADRQMGHVRTFQNGPRAAASQEILQQIATARVCLLDPARRADYDRQIRTHSAAAPPVAITEPPRVESARGRRRVGRRQRSPGVEIVKIVVGGVAGLLLGYVILDFGFGIDVLGLRGPVPKVAVKPQESERQQREKQTVSESTSSAHDGGRLFTKADTANANRDPTALDSDEHSGDSSHAKQKASADVEPLRTSSSRVLPEVPDLSLRPPGDDVTASRREPSPGQHDKATPDEPGKHPGAGSERPSGAIAPFNGDQANRHQQVWAKHLGVPVEVTNSIGMTLRLIPPGEFMMGSPSNEPGRFSDRGEDLHRVAITEPFYTAVGDVTQREYDAVFGSNPSLHQSVGTWRFPIENVSWSQAVRFCQRLSAMEHQIYRLPTEAEWEYACRAGTTTPYHYGKQIPDEIVGHNQTLPSHSFPANPFGLCGMHGNAWDWCFDWYDARFYRRAPLEDPIGPPTGGRKVIRGGSFSDGLDRWRSATRASIPQQGARNVSFRIVAKSRPMTPGSFPVSEASKGDVVDSLEIENIDCNVDQREIDVNSLVDTSKSWTVSLEFKAQQQESRVQSLFTWGDYRPGRDVVCVTLHGNRIQCRICDCRSNATQYIGYTLPPRFVWKWIPVTFQYDAERRVVCLFVAGRLVAADACLVLPLLDKPAPAWIGGVGPPGGEFGRFRGLIRNLWVANVVSHPLTSEQSAATTPGSQERPVSVGKRTIISKSLIRDKGVLPLPDNDALDEAHTQVKRLFRKERNAARTRKEKAQLTKRLLRVGVETNSGAYGRFAVLTLALDLATETGDPDLVILAVDYMADFYDINRLEKMASSLLACPAYSLSKEANIRLSGALLALSQEAVAADNYELTRTLLLRAASAARKADSKALMSATAAARKQLNQVETAFTELQPAINSLDANPDDASANTVAGMFYIAHKRDWNAGLAMLSKADDKELRETASRDLSQPKKPDDVMAIADGWWRLADRVETENSDFARVARRRSLEWYRAVYPMISGLAREELAARVNERFAIPGKVRIRFWADDSLRDFVSREPSVRVEGGEVLIDKHGLTYGTAFSSISSVKIKGRIVSPEGLNFRFLIGGIHGILNWEVKPENHFRRLETDAEELPPPTITRPRALLPGKAHDISVIQSGEHAVVAIDGKTHFRVKAKLAGTITFTGANGVIAIQELEIDGVPNVLHALTGPDRRIRQR